MKQVHVIIPFFNESLRITNTVKGLLAAYKEYTNSSLPFFLHFFWINDGSTDNSMEILEHSVSTYWKNSEIKNDHKIMHHFATQKFNSGKGSAVLFGIKKIIEIPHDPLDVVLFWDADDELAAGGLFALLKGVLASESDVVFGSRFSKRNPQVLGFRHYLGNKTLTLFSNWFSNLNLSDVHCCARALNLGNLLRLPLRSKGFNFEAEFVGLLGKMADPTLRITEVPISYSPRNRNEGKKIGLSHVLPQLWVAIYCRYFSSCERRSLMPISKNLNSG